MISLITIYCLIFVDVISNVHSQGSPGNILGQSACETYSVQQAACNVTDPPIESFPKECSSFLYCCLTVSNNTLTDLRETDQSIKGYLNKLLETNTPVVVFYSHESVQEWCAAIQPNNTAGRTTEMNNLKEFFDKHKGIKGILLKGLLGQDDPPSGCPDYNTNLKCYIDFMKNTFSNMSIGINIPVSLEMEYFQNPELPWLDFNILDPSVDFYRLDFWNINTCSDAFLKTGVYPLTGNSSYTVDQARTLVEDAGATPSKILYKFSVYPEPKGELNFCETFVANYCKNPKDAKTTMCGDTLQTLFEKGEYAKKHQAAGFFLNSIDNDDFDCTCQCGQSFPGFKAVLSGFNGGPQPPCCPLFDRT